MKLLMYFNSFGVMLVLFASTIAIIGWTAKQFIRAVWRVLQEPQEAPQRRNQKPALQAENLKRAGQF